MRFKLVGVVALMALVVASCGDGTSDAAGPSEDIGVHGAWTIDVINADGSLDERVQFHNEFTGEVVLADLLSMADTMTGWNLSVGSSICTSGSGQCSVDAAAHRDPATDELVVEASFVPELDGNVTRVFANVAGTSAGNQTFSQKLFDAADEIAVKAGQTVQVEVRYSFGTLP